MDSLYCKRSFIFSEPVLSFFFFCNHSSEGISLTQKSAYIPNCVLTWNSTFWISPLAFRCKSHAITFAEGIQNAYCYYLVQLLSTVGMKLNNKVQLYLPRLRSEQNQTVTATSAYCTYIPLQLTIHYKNITLQLTNHYTYIPLQLTAHCSNNTSQLTAQWTNDPLQLTAHCTVTQLALTTFYTNILFQHTIHCTSTEL